MSGGNAVSDNGQLRTAYALTVGVFLLASFAPSARLWGFNWYGYFSWYGPLFLLVSGALAWFLLRRVDLDSHGRAVSKPIVWWAAATALLVVIASAALSLPASRHFLGDGYQLLASLQAGVNHKPWETGTFALQKFIYSLFDARGEETARAALRITSWLSGAVFLLVSVLTAARLFETTLRRFLYLLGVSSGGYTLLFFGYLESYPLFIGAVGALFQVGLLAVRGRLSRWWIVPLMAVAVSFHIFAVAFLPGVLYLLLRGTRLGDRIASWSGRTKLLAGLGGAVAGAAVFIYFFMSSYFFRFTIVPPVSDRFTVEGYTLFSGKHLLDYVNHFIQLLPGLAVVLVALAPLRAGGAWRRPDVTFVWLTLLPAMGLVFIFNPGLGFPRDWDLFSFVGVPLVSGSMYLLLDAPGGLPGRLRAAALASVLGLLMLAPRVVSQAIPEKAIAVFDNYSNLDVIRNAQARFILLNQLEREGRTEEKKARERENARLLLHERWDREGLELYAEGRIAQAEGMFRQALEFAPCFAYSWANVGVCFSKRGQWDSAQVYFRVADAMNPFNADNQNSLGWAAHNLGRLSEAERHYREAIRLRPDHGLARRNLALLFRQAGRSDELVAFLAGTADLPNAPPELYFDSADELLSMGRIDDARRVCRRALEAGCDSSLIRSLEQKHPGFSVPAE